ncbi:insecticidal delta-endotoxin Cry8Ea1 family protein [Bacillus wiedmannii]|uniref:Crystaline entomocidal protoxin n=1 Tax=Bacillus thuringiensis TaxID=1428 RepID=A0A6F7TLM1_BACTU|nr:insecticidal delta-endotoxin Cry8Ea1 family protein [Bacillus wiedmannii]AEH76819.1 Cry4Aa3-like protein [Bacillus thuringiensis]
MHSYEKKNEYEILDASPNNSNMANRYPRYPLANDSQILMQKTNYKDWVNICQKTQKYDVDSEGFASTEIIAGVSAGLNITGTLLTGFRVTAPYGIALIVWGSLLPFVFPEDSPQITWRDLLTIGTRPYNRPIDETLFGHLRGHLLTLKEPSKKFQSDFDAWLKNRNSRPHANAVLSQFNILYNLYGQKELFRGVQALPLFVQIVTLELTLLQHGAKYYDEWSRVANATSINEIDSFERCYNSSECYKQILKENIQEYINYCTRTYNDGLSMIKNSSSVTWNIYNTYITEMTLTVLDIIAVFPNYDPDIYQIPVQSEITREIYTSTLTLNRDYSLDKLESDFTKRKSLYLFTYLKSLHLYHTIQEEALRPSHLAGVSNNTAPVNGMELVYGMYKPSDITSNDIKLYNNQPLEFIKSNLPTKLEVISAPQDIDIHQMIFIKVNGESVISRFTNQMPGTIRNIIFNLPEQKDPFGKSVPSHVLSYVKISPQEYSGLILEGHGVQASFGWSRADIDLNNTIRKDKITQIPAVKASNISSDTQVIQGPGHTGGNLIKLGNRLELSVTFEKRLARNYRIRIRYASKGVNSFSIDGYWLAFKQVSTTATFTDPDLTNLKYENFKYIEMDTKLYTGNIGEVGFNPLYLENRTSSPDSILIIDKIEFIPLTQTVLDNIEKQNLEEAQKSVNNLFTTDTKNVLKTEAADYEINQAANIVECVSEEVYPKEKMILLDEVKYAKQSSQSRNLLQNGEFESSTLGWTSSNNITIRQDNPIFKGHYLHMSGARDIDGTVFPTYIYQKIDESKLKPYTRYQVRGFVGSSKDLELVVSRYGGEIDASMNVPDDLYSLSPIPNCCETSFASAINQGDYTNTSNPCPYDRKKKHVVCHDSHSFNFHIDLGTIDTNDNTGIWVLFKISSSDGYATLGNLEVIEEGPLTGEALAHVKQKEKKWNQNMEKKRMESQQAYDSAKQAVDALFTSAQELQYHITLDHIKNVHQLVQSIPYVHHTWLSDVPGMNYDLYQGLNARIMQAYNLYNARNVITNGEFTQGLQGWHATGNAAAQQMDGYSVLVLSNWSAGVSQNLHAQDYYGYVLRVIAKKEGPGKGYVTIIDCNGKQETLTFTSCEEGYKTKTVEVFPESNHIRIEVGETEGTFYIQSVELLCMKGYNKNYNQNSSSMYNQNGTNNYEQHSGCTCSQRYNN